MADDDDLFVKDGEPVKFCFHKSVKQGRGQIGRDVERHGGQIVDDERSANVLLIDEQEDIALLRRRYYSSRERYRLSIYVEPRGFVQACMRSGRYQHLGPIKQGMPGRAPGRAPGRGVRVPFTPEDRDNLAYYIATRCPTRDGRMGNSVYKDLGELGHSEDASWAWASRHTWHSWREHYKMRPHVLDPLIDRYIRELKDVGHHFGQDLRSHDYRKNLQRQLEEEELRGDIEQPEQQDRRAPAPRPRDRTAREYPERHKDLMIIEDDEEDDGVAIAPQRVIRHRGPPDVRRRDDPVIQQRRAHVSIDEKQASDGEPRLVSAETPGSQEIEGSDLFADREYEYYQKQGANYQASFSAPGQNEPPPSTQATLVASPRFAEKAPSEPGPSVPRGKRAATVDTSFRNTRARSRSAEPRAQPQRESKGDNEKREIKKRVLMKDILIEEKLGSGHASVNGGILAADERAVENLLNMNVGEDEYTDEYVESDGDLPRPPPYEEIEVPKSEPSDSDDRETHGTLARGVGKDKSESESESEDQDEDDAERIERMASGKLVAGPVPRVTRSKMASQNTQVSPRRTRSVTQRSGSSREYALPEVVRGRRGGGDRGEQVLNM